MDRDKSELPSPKRNFGASVKQVILWKLIYFESSVHSNSSYEHCIIIEQGDTSKTIAKKRYSLQKITLSRGRKLKKKKKKKMNLEEKDRKYLVLNRNTK